MHWREIKIPTAQDILITNTFLFKKTHNTLLCTQEFDQHSRNGHVSYKFKLTSF